MGWRVLAMTACVGSIFGGAARAADLYREGSVKDAPVHASSPLWSGFYVGVHGGHADGDWDGKLTTSNAATDGFTTDPLSTGYNGAGRTLGADGGIYGVQVGYNKQSGKFVFGIEADISRADFDGKETFSTNIVEGSDFFIAEGDIDKTHTFDLDYFATIRGRLGYTYGRFMPYITGGLAFGETEAKLNVNFLDFAFSEAKTDASHVGYAVGAGIEASIGGNWSLKAEYLYVDLGEENYRFKFDGNSDGFDADLSFDVVRVGLNYKFGARDDDRLK
jgi:outer membrane immunogenic protein